MPEHWMDAEGVDTCSRCNTTKFTLTVRKHHCRFCGLVVCDKCEGVVLFFLSPCPILGDFGGAAMRFN